jgi:hypothetical protein
VTFAFGPRTARRICTPVSRLPPPITIPGTPYRVLGLDGGKRGPRYLLRGGDSELIGLFLCGAEPMRLDAAPLAAARGGSAWIRELTAEPVAKTALFT